MDNKSSSPKKSDRRKYLIQGINLDINVNTKVFQPPIENSISSKYINIEKGEKVIDIGTGCGILAILASKMGGKVYATDIDRNSIKLAEENAKLNKVDINFSIGGLFSSFEEKFDVIISNISQTILSPLSKNEMGELAVSVDGGKNGNKWILKLLRKARKYMDSGSRMYVNIYTISDYKKTIKIMRRLYNIKLLAKQSEPVKDFVKKSIKWYLPLSNSKKIKMIYDNKKKKWFAEQLFYELTKKQPTSQHSSKTKE